MPPIVCVIGKKKSGKTTTVVRLAAALGRRGWRVATIKHGHHFDLDREGADSWRHRHEGGARRVVLAGPEGFAVVGEWGPEGPLGPAALAERFLEDADVVVVEGFKAEPLPRIEVYRREAHPEPVYDPADPAAGLWLAIATDVPGFRAPFPVLDVHDPALAERLADLVEERVIAPTRSGAPRTPP